jgi:hypothetical protein
MRRLRRTSPIKRSSTYSLVALAVFGHWADLLLTLYLIRHYLAYESDPLALWWWSVLGGPYVAMPITAVLLGYYCLTGKNERLLNALRKLLGAFVILTVSPVVWILYLMVR